MALVLCPECRKKGFTWYMDEQEQTNWFCSVCDYNARENESKEKLCPVCGKNGAIRLTDERQHYYWCVLCGGYREDAT